MEEVAKITDDKVRSYYTQEMQKRIYETFGRGTLKNKFLPTKQQPKRTSQIKPPLGDIDLRFILAGMIIYPELIGDFEEKLLMFDVSKFNLFNMLNCVINSFREYQEISYDIIIAELKKQGFEKEIASLWEVNMLKSQNPQINQIKEQIDSLMRAVQIKQLDKDIFEYKLKLEKSTATDEDYQFYINLKNERDLLIKESNNI